MLKITNSFTGKKEDFIPLHPGKINLYVCGITPYDFAHVGHGRCYVTFDVLYRLLSFLGYEVKYCRNFTDIDDKLLSRAEKELGDAGKYKEIADRFIDAYHEDMESLNCISPDQEPRVTEMIPQIIRFVEGLVEKGAAYEIDGSIYFRVRKFSNYGKLSKQSLDDLRSGARINADEKKEDPLDFALWKKDDPQVSFESPWGYGRPGWHIECSAMARDFFNETVDIHGGGMDLIFPHHENEIAQSESLYDEKFVRYWMHNAFVRINKEKMSKSLGNFFTLKEVIKEFDPMVIRFYFLKHYYRGPLDYAVEEIEAAQKAYKKLVNFFQDIDLADFNDVDELKSNAIVMKMVNNLTDDLNTSGMFGVLFENLTTLQNDLNAKKLVKYFIVQIMGLRLEPIFEKKVAITPEIQKLIDDRNQARIDKDWNKADALRDELNRLGVEVQDKK